MKNGFFHERPNDYDIYVDESMVPIVGHESINGHVQNTRQSGHDFIADVEVDGQTTYMVVRQEHGADHFWMIVR